MVCWKQTNVLPKRQWDGIAEKINSVRLKTRRLSVRNERRTIINSKKDFLFFFKKVLLLNRFRWYFKSRFYAIVCFKLLSLSHEIVQLSTMEIMTRVFCLTNITDTVLSSEKTLYFNFLNRRKEKVPTDEQLMTLSLMFFR